MCVCVCARLCVSAGGGAAESVAFAYVCALPLAKYRNLVYDKRHRGW